MHTRLARASGDTKLLRASERAKGNRRRREIARKAQEERISVREREKDSRNERNAFGILSRDACDSCRGDTNVTVLCPGAGRAESVEG